MKKQNLFSVLLISTVAISIALPSLVNADPGAVPPGGNVDATFNSVNAGYGVTAPSVGGSFNGEDAGIQALSPGASGFAGYFYGTNGVYSEANTVGGIAGGFYNFAGTPVGVLLGYAGDALLASGPINLVGRIYSSSADPIAKYVNILDSDGVRIGNDAGTAQLTISGANGDIADPNGDVTVADDLLSTGFSKANSGFRLTGTLGTFTIDQIGQMTRMYDNTTSPLQILDANGMDIRGGIANGATFVDGNPVKIGEADGLLVTTNGGTQGLTIAATGDIADTNSAVKLADDQGLQIANTAGTVGLTVSGTGVISNTDTPVVIDDDDINTACTNIGKGAYISGSSAYCKKAVNIGTAGLDVAGTISNSVTGIPLLLSDSEGVWMSGTGDGAFWIEPNGTTGEVTLHNENGGVIRFNGADKVIVGSATTGLQLEPDGTMSTLGSGSVVVDDKFTINGTSGPSLTVGRVSGQPNIKAGSDNYLIMDSSGQYAAINRYVADNISLAYGGGNVGIGTASPAYKLDIDGGGSTSVDMRVDGRIQTGDASNRGGIWVNNPGTMFVGDDAGLGVGLYNSGWHLIADSSGNVGIGTATPTSKLDVNGHLKANTFGDVDRYTANKNILSHTFNSVKIACPANTIPLNCGYTNFYGVDVLDWNTQYISVSDSMCNIDNIYNKTAGTINFTATISCLDPNG